MHSAQRIRGATASRGKLKPGRYRATLTASDAAGNRSRAKRLTFKVVKASKKG